MRGMQAAAAAAAAAAATASASITTPREAPLTAPGTKAPSLNCSSAEPLVVVPSGNSTTYRTQVRGGGKDGRRQHSKAKQVARTFGYLPGCFTRRRISFFTWDRDSELSRSTLTHCKHRMTPPTKGMSKVSFFAMADSTLYPVRYSGSMMLM